MPHLPLPPKTSRHASGFTLIEVMVTVAIVAILAAIALPAYNSYLRRGKMQEAFSQLSSMRVQLEQYYQDNRNYGTTSAACPFAMPTSKYFVFTCSDNGVDSQNFLLTATGIATADLNGYVYTLDQNNTQSTTKFANTAVAKSCWLTRESDC